MKKLATIFALAAFALFASASVHAQNFGAGNIVVYRVGGDPNVPNGDGAAPLGDNATRVYLVEYTQAGGFVRQILLPDAEPAPTPAPAGTPRALTAQGDTRGAAFDGQITRSQDGRFITLTGYNRNPGSGPPALANAMNTERVVGFIDAAGNANTTAAINNAFGGNGMPPPNSANGNIRSAVTTGIPDANGNLSFFVVGSGTSTAVRLAMQNTVGSTAVSAAGALRAINIFGGQLFTLGPMGVFAVGSGVSTGSGQTSVAVPIASGAPTSAVNFFFADLNPSVGYMTTGLDTLYIVDEGANDLLRKYSYDGTNFQPVSTLPLLNPTGLTGFVTIPPTGGIPVVTLFTTYSVPQGTGASVSDSTLARVDDTGGSGGALPATPTNIASAPLNTRFLGVALAPLVNPTADEVLIEGRVTNARGVPIGGVTLRLSGSRQAVTRTNDDGFYRFEGVEVGGLYTVTAVARGFSFSPRTLTFGDVQTNTVADFTATPPSKGRRSRFSR